MSISFLTVGFQTLVNLAAGVARMPLRRYLPAAIIGSVAWALIYATVGFAGFAAFVRLYELSPALAIVATALVVAAIVTWVLVQVRAAHRQVDDGGPISSEPASADDFTDA